MTVVVILDKNNGMSFHKQRQSSDRTIIEYIIRNIQGRILVSPYTADLIRRLVPSFASSPRLVTEQNPIEKAGPADIVINEEFLMRLNSYRIDRLLIARWAVTYPADMYLDLDLSRFQKESEIILTGTSHEKIAIESYRKR